MHRTCSGGGNIINHARVETRIAFKWKLHGTDRQRGYGFIARLLGALYQEEGVRARCFSIGNEVSVDPKRDNELRNWSRLQELDCSNKETKERIAVLPAVGQDKARRDRRDWRVQSELTSSKEAMISDRQDSRNELEGAGAACERMPNEPFATRWGG